MAEVKGLDRLTLQLRSLPEAMKTTASEALHDKGQELARKIAAACQDPVLAQHVTLEDGPARVSQAGQLKAQAGLVVHVQSIGVHGEKNNVHNPTWEEFGTAAHSTAKGADRASGKLQDRGPHHPGAKRRPFFWPTVRAWRKPMRAAMSRATNKAAKTIAGKS